MKVRVGPTRHGRTPRTTTAPGVFAPCDKNAHAVPAVRGMAVTRQGAGRAVVLTASDAANSTAKDIANDRAKDEVAS